MSNTLTCNCSGGSQEVTSQTKERPLANQSIVSQNSDNYGSQEAAYSENTPRLVRVHGVDAARKIPPLEGETISQKDVPYSSVGALRSLSVEGKFEAPERAYDETRRTDDQGGHCQTQFASPGIAPRGRGLPTKTVGNRQVEEDPTDTNFYRVCPLPPPGFQPTHANMMPMRQHLTTVSKLLMERFVPDERSFLKLSDLQWWSTKYFCLGMARAFQYIIGWILASQTDLTNPECPTLDTMEHFMMLANNQIRFDRLIQKWQASYTLPTKPRRQNAPGYN